MRVEHTLEPILPQHTKVLVLGSFPSVKSRAWGIYYGNPQNRFWRWLAIVLEAEFPETPTDKLALASDYGIGIWDVIQSCEITGSSDASIKNVVLNPIPKIVADHSVRAIFTTGKKAHDLYVKYFQSDIDVPLIGLPSPSPANRRYEESVYLDAYKVIRQYL